jgi:hypothetical protein
MWLTRILSSTVFLGTIIFTIPLAFDIGGRTCGLAFSLALSTYYFIYSALRLATPDESRFRWTLCNIFAVTQWLMIPTLLIWSLNKFSVDSDNNSGWVERTFGGKRAQDTSVYEWMFGVNGLMETVTIGTWDKVLRYSTPVFQVGEGFCSLLVIQAAGQITRWLVNRERGDSWMVRFQTDTTCLELTKLDWPSYRLCVHHIVLGLLPLANNYISRDQQCGCHPHRCRHHYCHIPLRLGYC